MAFGVLRDPTRVPGYRWYLLSGVMVCSWGITWYTYSLGVLLPFLRDDLGLSHSQEGLLGSSFFLASFLLTIPLTNWFSKIPPVRLNAAILVLTTCLFFVAAYAPNYYAQFGIRFLVAALFVANNPVRTTITHLWFRPKEYAAANGVANSSFGIIEPLAFWASAPLAQAIGGWQPTYYFIGVVAIVLTAIWILFARERRVPLHESPSSKHDAGGASPLNVLRRGEVWAAGMVSVGAAVTWSSFVTFWPTVAQEDFGLSKSTSGFIWGFSALGILPGSLLAPVLLARVGKRKPLIMGATAYVFVIYPPMLLTANVPLLLMFSILQGLSWMFFPLLMTVPFQLRRVNAREIAVATAFIMVLNRGALALGSAVAGSLGEIVGLRQALIYLCAAPIISFIGAILLGEIRPEHPPPLAGPAATHPEPAPAA